MIVNPFAGPGGWDLGARSLGIETVGYELDDDTCATRAAVGFVTVKADVAAVELEPLLGTVEGLIASPPCQAFSLAGKQLGHDDLPRIFETIRNYPDPWSTDGWGDPRTPLILEPLRWAWTLRPRWVVCEQVKPCIDVWRALGRKLEEVGYRWWAGVLNAADFGVPQTRERAIFIASLDRQPGPPPATHGRDPQPSLFGAALEPWVSMAQALGWTAPGVADGAPALTVCGHRTPRWAYGDFQVGFPRLDDRGDSEDGYRERDWRDGDEPSFALTEKARSWTVRGVNTGRDWKPGGTRDDAQVVPAAEPAPTVDASDRPWHVVTDEPDAETLRLPIEAALVLQSFPADYPLCGNKTAKFRQVGDAVPPRLAAAVLASIVPSRDATFARA